MPEFEQNAHYSNDYHLVAANVRAGKPKDWYSREDEEFVELYFCGDAYKLAYQGDQETPIFPAAGESLLVREHFLSGKKQVVVERDDNDLTAQETKQHWPEVAAAIQKELETWASHKCMSRKSRHLAKNILKTAAG